MFRTFEITPSHSIWINLSWKHWALPLAVSHERICLTVSGGREEPLGTYTSVHVGPFTVGLANYPKKKEEEVSDV